ncbi:MAG: glycoside hydrolase family 13 protein [Defluviitaleaceae bacterium]|nr:glycoside hydrolase family 13 protein [Defluviitaleaceae bacterium]
MTPKNIREKDYTKIDKIIFDGIYSDETEFFQYPPESKINDFVTFYIRTVKDNIGAVYLNINNDKYLMKKKNTENSIFSIYSFKLRITQKYDYYFTLIKGDYVYFYNKKGLSENIDISYNFKVIPNFSTPNWAKGAVMYQIFVDRFYNGDKSNDVLTKEYSYLGTVSKKQEDWNAPVENNDFCTFYGGDLQGIIDKIPYLKDLGIEAIYLTPIFVSPSNHKYDISDYEHIDPHFGIITEDGGKRLSPNEFDNQKATMYIKRTTSKENLEKSNKLFENLVSKAHGEGIKVILDGVFNHCGAFHKWLNKEKIYKESGAYQSEESKYKDFFKWYDNNWPDNIAYDGWWGHSNHPKLNYENSKELYDYILNIGKKWLSHPYNADGWRLDVAADLGQSEEFNHKFWKDFREAVKKENPNSLILSEHYGDPSSWLLGDEWDTIMNYDAFMEPITWFLTGINKHSEVSNFDLLNNTFAFEEAMLFHNSKLTFPSLYTSMNQLSNHDHSRFLTRTNQKIGRLHNTHYKEAENGINKAVMYLAVVFQFTWIGAPTIYYGDEAGLCGFTDPDNRRSYPWGKEDKTMLNLHKELIKIRKTNISLKKGSLTYLHNEHGFISFGRFTTDEKIVIVLNNNEYEKTVKIPVWKLDIKDGNLNTLIKTGYDGFSINNDKYEVCDGFVEICIGAKNGIILKY